MVNSNDQVEIFGNDIRDNKTANIILSSVYSANYADDEAVEGYDPYPEAIYIYDNKLSGGGNSPDGADLKALKVLKFGLTGSFPHVLWDGFEDAEKLVDGKMPEDLRICIQNGDLEVLNADGPNKYKNPNVQTAAEYACELKKLPAVELAAAG